MTNASNLLYSCSGLTSVDLTPLAGWVNVTDASYLLYRCSGLTSVDLTPLTGWTKVTRLSYLLRECSKLTSVDLSPFARMTKVTSMSAICSGCSVLEKVKGEEFENLINITEEGNAFYNCKKLQSIHLPIGYSKLGSYSYGGCPSLKYIKSRKAVPHTIESTTFDNSNNCPIYVPDESVDAYRTATNWTAIADRIKPMSQFAIDFPEEEV